MEEKKKEQTRQGDEMLVSAPPPSVVSVLPAGSFLMGGATSPAWVSPSRVGSEGREARLNLTHTHQIPSSQMTLVPFPGPCQFWAASQKRTRAYIIILFIIIKQVCWDCPIICIISRTCRYVCSVKGRIQL